MCVQERRIIKVGRVMGEVEGRRRMGSGMRREARGVIERRRVQWGGMRVIGIIRVEWVVEEGTQVIVWVTCGV